MALHSHMMGKAHDRRSVALSPDLVVELVATGMPSERAEQMVLNLGEPAEVFEWYRVGTAMGNARNQRQLLLSRS